MTVACLPQQSSHHHQPITPADLSILSLLTKSPSSYAEKFTDRRPQLDPLILETAALSSPAQTRNHYLHQYHFQNQPQLHHHHPHHQQDDPHHHQDDAESTSTGSTFSQSPSPSPTRKASQVSTHQKLTIQDCIHQLRHSLHKTQASLLAQKQPPSPNTDDSSLSVKCQARTRIPTPDGQLWLHLYTNNRDQKEHLAFVIDQEQMLSNPTSKPNARWIRSTSLDEIWNDQETEIERLIRGAYVGRLGRNSDRYVETSYRSVRGKDDDDALAQSNFTNLNQVPIVRIHSECFTGETIGSQRCDCGEQLSESIRHIFTTPPYKGAVIYLRQEGRGIGLLNKIKAYNLQELGFDTLESNLLLGFGPDLRDYQLAYQILSDLNLLQIRLMTNNPNKIEALTNSSSPSSSSSSINVLERIPMIPRHWQSISIQDQNRISRAYQHQLEPLISSDGQMLNDSHEDHHEEISSEADLLRHGSELDIYLRTKVNRMRMFFSLPALQLLIDTFGWVHHIPAGHLIPLPPSTSNSS
ncbi:hypothetical protein VP01_272g6 [Puccinia sorghi]|uniref:GTP cyclohydrolase II n=1 Tax=Puccinia sorghi TaxID=27349 RepID=A0A0L6V3Y7_9BASI|nr:hypothetical protein VP01_272g6 [Puccinia sorghi]